MIDYPSIFRVSHSWLVVPTILLGCDRYCATIRSSPYSVPGRSARPRWPGTSKRSGNSLATSSTWSAKATLRGWRIRNWHSNPCGVSLSWTRSTGCRGFFRYCAYWPIEGQSVPGSWCWGVRRRSCFGRGTKPWRVVWLCIRSTVSHCRKWASRITRSSGFEAAFPVRTWRHPTRRAEIGARTSSARFSSATCPSSVFGSAPPPLGVSGPCWRTTTARYGTPRNSPETSP